jgi:outer membrane protein OmpA-like peptidoglycan-associated protein
MRGGQRRHRNDEEDESVFVSMTDMTVSFLFIVMILLAFFAKRFVSTETVPKKQYDYIKIEHDRLFLENEQNKKSINEAGKEIKLRDKIILALESEIKSLNIRIKSLEDEILELKMRLTIKNPLEIYISEVTQQRRKILEELQLKLNIEFPDLKVVISDEVDALRFQGDGLFDTNSSAIRIDKKKVVESIARKLNDILPCYTIGNNSKWHTDCNSTGAIIEAIQIEGHTDIVGNDASNLSLSTNRANATFFAMTGHVNQLVEHKNFRMQPVLSVAGYGQMRPIATNDTIEGRRTNRRIDIRIIMYIPSIPDEIKTIKEKLAQGVVQQVRP